VNLTGGACAPPFASLLAVPSGLPGVRRTLKLMVQLQRRYKTDLNIRTLAVELVRDCAPKDRRAELETLQVFCRDAIRYVADIENVETLQTPIQTLKVGCGDCDDKATLLAALAGAIGFPARFCAIGVEGQEFSHVMMQGLLGTRWVNCETILPDVGLGWFPPDATQLMFAHC
jgi:transglutaminase-like putative cysteine protease